MIGTKLAHYEITAHLGSGGMGDVYQATDLKLKRSVAIKMLPAEFASDAERLSRFRREAQLLASLNHPNIAQIFGLEESGGKCCIAMELVEGETLQARLKRGPIPVDEALGIAKQICEALEAAHEKGVIHRDLKPGNVMLTADGKVKVLDFGLAKAMESDTSDANLSNSPTLMSAASAPGVILGTAAYMSPEQAKGRKVDKRTDIFAFGCVLYEMLTGKRAFDGEDVTDILSAVVRMEPDWTLLPDNLPSRIRELLRLSLEKNSKNRRSDANDVRLDIEQALKEPGTALPQTEIVERPPWKRAKLALAGVTLATLVGVAVWNLRPTPPPAIVTRFAFTLGEGQVPTNTGYNLVAISPDGTEIVYVANLRLYLRRMGELEAKAIPGSETPGGIVNPVFSPDGSSIAFESLSDNALKRIAVSGGAAISLCPAKGAVTLDWSEGGILFVQGKAIMRVSANGGNPETLVTLKNDEAATAPQMLPGRKALLFSLATGAAADRWDKAKIVVQAIGSAERKVLIEGGSNAHYLPTGHIVYAFSGTLRAVPFDLKRLEVTGGPVPVVEGVRRAGLSGTLTAIADFGFSSNGSLVYAPGPASVSTGSNLDLARIDREGHAEPLKLQPGSYSMPRVSPNGKKVAFQTDDGTDSIVWIYDLSSGSAPLRLTFGGNNRFPVWSPDSKWVAFQSDREGDLAIFQQRADGSGTAERLTKPEAGASNLPDSWSPDGNTLLFEVQKGSAGSLWALSLRDKKAAGILNVAGDDRIDASFSPDGRWVTYTSYEKGAKVFVQPFPLTGAKYQIPESGAHAPAWSPDGKELFYIPGPGVIDAVSIAVQPSFAMGNPVAVFKGAATNSPLVPRKYDLMPDGKHIVDSVTAGQDPASPAYAPQIQVILNWFEDLKQRVPVR